MGYGSGYREVGCGLHLTFSYLYYYRLFHKKIKREKGKKVKNPLTT